MSLDIIKKDIKIDPETGCWNWQKSLSSSGYGQKMINGVRHNSLHRYVYSLSHDIKPDEVVRHKCHNRACCNPDHLVSGTRLDNYNDSREVYKEAAKKQRKEWWCNGIKYDTYRTMVKETGISSATIFKYMKDGVFDVDEYRIKCKIGNKIPKI